MKFVDHEVFNEETAYEVIAELTQNTLFRIIFMCPYTYIRRIERCKDYFAAAIRRGVVICVILQAPSGPPTTEAEKKQREHVDRAIATLLSIGVHITFRKKIHVKVAIFDEIFLCDGSINFLSHSDTHERMNRFESAEMVREAVKFHALDCCETCASMQPAQDRLELTRLSVKNRRKALGMSINDVAAQTSNASIRTIKRFESGNFGISLGALNQICHALGMVIRVVPVFVTPALDQLLHKTSNSPLDPKSLRKTPIPCDTKVIGSAIKDRRTLLLLTQEELALPASIDRKIISALEQHNSNVSLHNLEKVCVNLGLVIRVVPVSIVAEVDSALCAASAQCIAHSQRMYEGMIKLMRSIKTVRLVRLFKKKTSAKQRYLTMRSPFAAGIPRPAVDAPCPTSVEHISAEPSSESGATHCDK